MTMTGTVKKMTEQFEGKVFHGAATLTARMDEDKKGRVGGIAVKYNQAGHFGWGPPITIAPGAAEASVATRGQSDTRDILALIAHQNDRVLARTSNGTLSFEDGPDGLAYSAQLNLDDPDGLAAWEKTKRGDFTAASIGFGIVEGQEVSRPDNSSDADPELEGENVTMFEATEIDIMEVSLVARGVFEGSTTKIESSIELMREQLPAGWTIIKETTANGNEDGKQDTELEASSAAPDESEGGEDVGGDVGSEPASGKAITDAIAEMRKLGII